MATTANNTDLYTGCGICGAEFCEHGQCRMCGVCPACEGSGAPAPAVSPAAEQERLRVKAIQRREALYELQGAVCPCGNKKQPKQSFCRACYGSLPFEVKNGLYQTFEHGYVGWWDKAKGLLRASGRVAVSQ